MQFHWWDYSVPGCVEAAGCGWTELRREGKIDLIGGTNFDTPHTEALVAAGVPLASMQVQYSLLDARAENALVAACRGTASISSATARSPAVSERRLARRGRSRSRRSRTARSPNTS